MTSPRIRLAGGAISPLQLTSRRCSSPLAAQRILVILALTASGQSAGQAIEPRSIPGLLDRYQNGEFDAAVQLATTTDPAQVRSSFIAAADAWIARGATDIINRRLVATAFAIELAQARLAYDNTTLIVLIDWASVSWRTACSWPSCSAQIRIGVISSSR